MTRPTKRCKQLKRCFYCRCGNWQKITGSVDVRHAYYVTVSIGAIKTSLATLASLFWPVGPAIPGTTLTKSLHQPAGPEGWRQHYAV
jgi:hypothetical protein